MVNLSVFPMQMLFKDLGKGNQPFRNNGVNKNSVVHFVQASPKQATTVNLSIPVFPVMILSPHRTQAWAVSLLSPSLASPK